MGSSQTFTEEWKSLFPISSVFKPPLLLSNPFLKPILGPLIFNPKPNSTTLLFSSSSSLLPALPPLPHLSLPRFLLTSPPDSAPLPSSVPSVASFLGPHHPKSDVSSSLLYNRLEFLQCPQINTVVVFFPTGENSDQVGFLQLVLKGSTFDVKVDENGGVFASRRWFSYRISRISVNPIPGFSSLRGPKDLPRIARTAGRLAGRSIGYVQLARGQFDNVMQQSQARQVHKELQDAFAQLESIRYEVRSISLMNPGPMARRLMDNPQDLASLSDGGILSIHTLLDDTFRTSDSPNLHSQATAYAKLAESDAVKTGSLKSSAEQENLKDESGLSIVLPISAESTGMLPNPQREC